MRTILHCSDLHFGRADQSVVESLSHEISKLSPDVVVISGDLTQRARTHEFVQARIFLSRLTVPTVVIPGNHDVSLFNLVARFISPFGNYKEWIHNDPFGSFTDEQLNIAALNTARSFTIDSGKVRNADLERIGDQWRAAHTDALKVLVSHHPLDLDSLKRKFAWGKDKYLAGEKAWLCKPDLLLSGHLHGTAAYVQRGCVQIAAGTTTSNRLRKEANSFNLIVTQPRKILVQTYSWNSSEFSPSQLKGFLKIDDQWEESEALKSEKLNNHKSLLFTDVQPR